jgi:NADP-dependent 3-hydroxy acid dehydrogenase YdfG
VRVIVIEPGAVAAELVDHITHADTKQAIEQFYDATSIIPAEDIAQIIAFAVSRPRSVSINEILIRPTAQTL